MALTAKSAGRVKRWATLTACCAAAAALYAGGWRWANATHVWPAAEVPVAFWAWRTAAPSAAEVEAVRRATGARTLFVRAGQFDYAAGRIARIRSIEGEFPQSIELHLVYNATPALLAAFGRLSEEELAEAATATFARDALACEQGRARIAGLQLDFDVPTRLLPHYGRMLAAVRRRLPAGKQLSVTGLPTWMSSAALGRALTAVDFWSPQFYGAQIPRRLSEAAPIASEQQVARETARARALGKPFYAGLAAYGYSGLYSAQGELRALRGDLDPEEAARHAGLELVERRAFAIGERDSASADAGVAGAAGVSVARAATGGWKYVFRAREAVVVDGTRVAEGESLVFYLTSVEGLRAALKSVRENAGDALLGVCLFRLPTQTDRTTLGLAQIAAALADREANASTTLRAERWEANAEAASNQLHLTVTNDGAANGRLGEGALTITLRLRPGSLLGVSSLAGFDTVETLCALDAARTQPCSPRRAGLVRLSARSWAAGATARVGLSFAGEPPDTIESHLLMRTDDGRTLTRASLLQTNQVEHAMRAETRATILAAGMSER